MPAAATPDDFAHRLALPPGYELEGYRIEGLLGKGGFGMTYLAVDLALDMRVAIKEMLPDGIATRVNGSTVVPQTRAQEQDFQWARQRFTEEARLLAKLQHPNIVRVQRLLEANGTACMVMEFIEGQSFSAWLKINPKPAEEDLRAILMPLLDGLECVHEHGLLHRDIKPDNIFLTAKGRPILLDFGSARADAGRTQTMTAVVSEGYSPFEQYQRKARQTPPTDLYSLAGVMARAITGETPATAIDRVADAASQTPVSRTHAGRYSAVFLSAVDAAFAVKPEDRPQSVAAWREMLSGKQGDPQARRRGERSGTVVGTTVALKQPPSKSPSHDAARNHPRPWLPWIAGVLLSVATGTTVFVLLGGKGASLDRGAVAASADSAKPSPARQPVVAAPVAGMPPAPPRAGNTPAGATKESPFVNALGMKFVPVPGTEVLFCVHETRSRDYAAFMADPGRGYTMSGSDVDDWRTYENEGVAVGRGAGERAEESDHSVCSVNWDDASAFCQWLSRKEGRIYRLPTDHEWSMAVGIGGQESASASPESKDVKIAGVYPWGGGFPPMGRDGNYADSSITIIEGYRDGYATTAPVMSFDPNNLGLYDMGGNVWEWCQDLYSRSGNSRVMRGGSWIYGGPSSLLSSYRYSYGPGYRYVSYGFRCVVVVGDSSGPD